MTTFTLAEVYGTAPGVQEAKVPKPTESPIHSTFRELSHTYGATISSLDRSPEKNAKVGGKPNSQHLRGTAGDFVVPKERREAFIADARNKGFFALDEGDHVHLQLPKGHKDYVASTDVGGGSGGGVPTEPIDPNKKTYSLEEIYSAGPVAKKEEPTTLSGILGSTVDAFGNAGEAIVDTGKRIVGKVGERLEEEFVGDPNKAIDKFMREANYVDVPGSRPSHLKEKNPEGEGFMAGLANPVRSFLEDSLPANFLENAMNVETLNAAKEQNRRKIEQTQNIVDNPTKYPAVSVEAAKKEIARRKEMEPTIRKAWDSLKEAAKRDPGKFAGQLANSILADPELLFAPIGLGGNIAKTGTAANTVARLGIAATDAAAVGALTNVAIGSQAAQNKGEEYKIGSLENDAVMGIALAGPMGLVFHNGLRARQTPLEELSLADKYENLRQQAIMDEAMERAIREERDPMMPTEFQKALNEKLGIKSKKEAEQHIQERRKEIKKTFKDNADYVDYLKFKDEERAARRLQVAEESDARAAEGAKVAEEARTKNEVSIPQTPDGKPEWNDVLRALKKPAFQRTAEEKVIIQKFNQTGSIDPELAVRMGLATAGAGTGAYLADDKHRMAGAFLGGLGGFILPGGGSVLSKFRQAGAIDANGNIAGLLLKERKLPNEADVIAKAKTGDQQAYTKLYNQYYPQLVRSLRPVLKNVRNKIGMEAEDVAQDAFTKAFQSLDTFKGDSEFYTWLYRIAQNEGMNAISKGGRRVETKSMHKTPGDSGESAGAGHIIRDADEAVRPEVLEAGTFDSPENMAIANETFEQLNSAFDKLPKDIRDVVVAKEIDMLSEAEIAEKLDVPLGTVKSRLNRGRTMIEESLAKGYGAKKVPKGQRGSVDPELLKIAGGASALGLAGAYLNEENPLGGATVGAVIGGLAAASRGRIGKATDYALGPISSRIKEISAPVHHRALEFERRTIEGTHGYLKAVDPFLTKINNLKPEVKDILTRSILTNDPNITNNLLKEIKDPTLIKEWGEVRKVLDSLKDKLQALGRFKKGIVEYFPRIVKDRDGLLKALGKEKQTWVRDKLLDAEKESIAKRGVGLSEVEQSMIINQAMRGFDTNSHQPGFAKFRGIDEITPALQKFYATPAESLHSYIRSAVEDIEKAKFFGKNLANTVKDGQKFTNVDDSVGNIVREQLKAGKITDDQAQELSAMLKSRFRDGQKAPSEIIQFAKNLGNAGLLGNVFSAATQLGDTVMNVYYQGLRPTLSAVVKKVTGRSIVDMRDFGLIDHIAEEFISTKKSARFLNAMLKYGGFSFIDRLGKDISLNAALIKGRSQAMSAKGIEKLKEKYGDSFGDDFDQLITDLKAKKSTDLTNSYAFHELSRSQPISKMEMSQFYLDSPNGRTLLWLKTFMMKQIDLARRDAFGEIRKGNKAKGLANLVKLGTTMGIAGMTTDAVKKLMMGEEIDLEASDIPMNMLKTFGLSQYVLDKASGEGGKAKPVETVTNMFIPPFKMMDEIIRLDPKAVRYIPVIGRPLYEAQVKEDNP